MEKLGYTRQTQKLIYWLLDDFANFWQGNEAGARPSFIELAYTKEVMKAKFVKIYDGFDTVKNAVLEHISYLEENKGKIVAALEINKYLQPYFKRFETEDLKNNLKEIIIERDIDKKIKDIEKL